MDPNAALSVSSLYVRYQDFDVLKDVSLSVAQGETFGLIGLNGAGKTTLIKSILSLRTPQAGEISIFGHGPEKQETRFNTAYLPERFLPSWFLTGIEFLRFSQQLYKVEFNQAQAVSLAESLALAPEDLERRVTTYSKGMKQKLGLIATLLAPARLLILDEPMSGLDPYARSLMKQALRAQKAKGRTMFLCSHILADMAELCDTIGVMHKGKIIYTGATASMPGLKDTGNLENAFLNLVAPAA